MSPWAASSSRDIDLNEEPSSASVAPSLSMSVSRRFDCRRIAEALRYVNDSKICQAVGQMLARIGLDIKVDTMP